MSAFIVGKPHIDAMLRAGLTVYTGRVQGAQLSWSAEDRDEVYAAAGGGEAGWAALTAATRKLDHTTADQVGQMLVDENVRSIMARYPDTRDGGTMPGPCDPHWEREFQFNRAGRVPTAVEALSLVDCYEYQACEHDGWKGSEAERFCEALRRALIGALPGYDEAPWEWRES